jgi:hypothetical protein
MLSVIKLNVIMLSVVVPMVKTYGKFK